MNKFVWSAYAAVYLPLVFILGWGQRMAVVPSKDIGLTKTVDSTEVVANVVKGTRLAVVGCIDTKSYIIPEVRTSAGVTGYVVDGPFEIERRGVLEFSVNSPINFSCPGGERLVLTP